MLEYKIEKPAKGAGIIEYILKYITLFFLIGIILWAVFLFVFVKLFSDKGLTESLYMYSLIVSLLSTVSILALMIKQLIAKLSQGTIYQIKFNDDSKSLKLSFINEFTGVEFEETIPYTDLSTKENDQKIEIKSELTISIFNNKVLLNKFNIAKTPWTAHPKIVEIVDELRKGSDL